MRIIDWLFERSASCAALRTRLDYVARQRDLLLDEVHRYRGRLDESEQVAMLREELAQLRLNMRRRELTCDQLRLDLEAVRRHRNALMRGEGRGQ